MSASTSASDEKELGVSAGGSIPAFSIDGLLGLRRRQHEASDKTSEEEDTNDDAATSPQPGTPPGVHQLSQTSTVTLPTPAAATHFVYSAAAAATMIPSSALHGRLWSSHPAASIAAFRCKF